MSAPMQIVVFPCGQLTPKEKERLTRHGILAVEADDPSAVRVLAAEAAAISANDLTRAALASRSPTMSDNSITSAGRQMAEFVKLLAEAAKP